MIAVWTLEDNFDNGYDSAVFVVLFIKFRYLSYILKRLFNQTVPWIDMERNFGKVNGAMLHKSNCFALLWVSWVRMYVYSIVPSAFLLLNSDHPPLMIGNLRFKLHYCGLLLSALFCDFREKLQPIKSLNCFLHVSAVLYFLCIFVRDFRDFYRDIGDPDCKQKHLK